MAHEQLITEFDSRGVVRVTLNRVQCHNAFDDAMIDALYQSFQAIGVDSKLRVLILQAAGKHFSAGADLAWMSRVANYDYGRNLADAKKLARMLAALNALPQTTIACVHGASFGGGVGLISCCDIVLASPESQFCLSEVKLGIVPATISPYVIQAIGARAARRYFQTAEKFDAARARELGLVSEIVTESDLDSRVSEQIEALLANGPQAVKLAKQLVSDVAGKEINEPLSEQTSACIARARSSEEGKEGLQAFLQKRKPNWPSND